MKKLIHLDDLVRRCGYFANTRDRTGRVKNNGYGCTHRGNKEEPGECHSYCCPVACETNYKDMAELDPDLAEEYKEEQEKHGSIQCQWMVVWRPMYLKKIFGEEGLGNGD